MYHDIGTMWEGFIKWMYSVASLSSIALMMLIIAAYFFFLAPFYWLWNALTGINTISDMLPVIGLQVFIIMFMRWVLDRRFKEPLISTILHPLGLSFLFVASLYAFLLKMVGAGVSWKRRIYGKESSIE